MSLWKIGVGVPIHNNSFKYGCNIYAKVNNSLINITSGSGELPLIPLVGYNNDTGTDAGHSDKLFKYLRIGDRIRIGPSTYERYEGAFEEYRVAGLGTNIIMFDSIPTVRFEDGDPISGIGTNSPGGWTMSANTVLTMGGITNHTLTDPTTSKGYKDRFSSQFQNTNGTRGIFYYFSNDNYLKNVYYRMGCYYQFRLFSGTGSLIARSTYNSTNFINATMISAATTDWKEYNSAAAQSGNVETTIFRVAFLITIPGGGPGGVAIANIDNVYLEHADSTDDETSGVYTFDDYPEIGSRGYKILNDSKIMRLNNNRAVMLRASDDTDNKFIIEAQFKDVTRTLRENLEILLDWQDRGNYLVLHHDIPEVPPNLYGILTVSDTSLANWSIGKCSFNISFEEF